MIRVLKGTNFVIGSFVDAGSAERQEAADVRCVLKATDQPIDGRSAIRFPFHHPSGYLNLEFADNGACDVGEGQNAFLWVKDWLKGAEQIIKDEGKGKIMVHSWTGAGKAVRLLAAHLCGWVRSRYKDSLARIYKEAEIAKTAYIDLPEFEAALLDTLDADPVDLAGKSLKNPKVGPDNKPLKKKKKRGTRRPKLD